MLNFPSFFNAQVGGYEIEQSLRFDGAQSLSRTAATAGNRKTFTVSAWVKTASPAGIQNLFSAYQTGGASEFSLSFRDGGSSNPELVYDQGSAAPGGGFAFTNAVYRDFSAWLHVVYVGDYSNATATERIRLFVNGERINSFRTIANGIDSDGSWNWAGAHHIGRSPSDSNRFNGYMAELHSVDGTALDPTDFGEYDDNGVWRPIRYTGSYGTNGFYLKFDPSATNGIGHDHSGNGNNFSPTGFSTSGTGTDVMSDTPTTNWCTLNPLANAWSNTGSGSTADGNLYLAYSSGNWYGKKGTIAVSSGKWYYEWTNTSGGTSSQCGFTTIESASETGSGVYRYRSNGEKVNTAYSSYGATWSTAGDIIGVALDIDGGTITFYKNGTSQGTAFSGIPAGTYIPECVMEGAGYTGYANFGQRAFAYTPPTGFKALNTSNLSAPTVKDGSQYFNTVLYTGNNTTHPITGVGFAPDFVWIKPRNFADHHRLNDKIRGVNKTLSSNITAAEYGPSNAYLDSFDSDGFTISGSDAGWNNSSYTYVAWNWLAGGTGSSNTDGTITSTVSANASAGFSIATYTGNGTAGATVGHGLGVAPSMIITKARGATSEWGVYHSALGNTKALLLNQTYDQQTSSLYWNNTSPTSTLFTLGSGSTTNSSTTYVAYCFAEVEGYSKFGSYTGNGVADGPFIYCGFRPRWVLVKASPTTSQWVMWDTARNTYNFADKILYPNLSSAESVFKMDILSNGFKFREDGGAGNDTGVTYIFAAFAEHPFGGDGVSPATAR